MIIPEHLKSTQINHDAHYMHACGCEFMIYHKMSTKLIFQIRDKTHDCIDLKQGGNSHAYTINRQGGNKTRTCGSTLTLADFSVVLPFGVYLDSLHQHLTKSLQRCVRMYVISYNLNIALSMSHANPSDAFEVFLPQWFELRSTCIPTPIASIVAGIQSAAQKCR